MEAEVTYSTTAPQITGLLAWGVFALIGVGGLVSSSGSTSRVFFVALLVVAVVAAYRSVRAYVLVVNREEVIARSLLRTWRHLFTELVDVEVVDGRVGAYPRSYLRFIERGGKYFDFKGYSRGRSGRDEVVRAAEEIKGLIRGVVS